MKKVLMIFLLMALALTLAACEGKTPSEGPASAEPGENQSGEAGTYESMVYGIGESAEANGISITIDKVEAADPYIALEKAKDGFSYMKVWFTFKNVSSEPLDSPDRKDIYIVYEEGPTGDDSDINSDVNSQVMLEVVDRDERYMLSVELAPGESTGGWMVYQRQIDKDEIIMHYYSGFINVAPDLVFGFTAP